METELKYLFTAIYNDGTQLEQTQKDISKTVEGGSAYTDVDHSKLDVFVLKGEGHVFAVNPNTGIFQVDNAIFGTYDKPVVNRRLIFFRRHRHNFNEQREQLSHEVEYHLGWQGNEPDTNKNIQRVIFFS